MRQQPNTVNSFIDAYNVEALPDTLSEQLKFDIARRVVGAEVQYILDNTDLAPGDLPESVFFAE